jgi:hypothetical protein
MSLTSYLDIKSIPELGLHERDRAMQRSVVCLIATAVWTFELWMGRFDPLPYRLGLVLSIGYLLVNLAYLQFGNGGGPPKESFSTSFWSVIRHSLSACLCSIRTPSPFCIRCSLSSSSEAGSDMG